MSEGKGYKDPREKCPSSKQRKRLMRPSKRARMKKRTKIGEWCWSRMVSLMETKAPEDLAIEV